MEDSYLRVLEEEPKVTKAAEEAKEKKTVEEKKEDKEAEEVKDKKDTKTHEHKKKTLLDDEQADRLGAPTAEETKEAKEKKEAEEKTEAEEAKEKKEKKEAAKTTEHKKKTLLDDEHAEEPTAEETKEAKEKKEAEEKTEAEEAKEKKEAEEAKEKKETKTAERKKRWLVDDEQHPNRDPLVDDESERLQNLDDTIKSLAKGRKHKPTTLLAGNANSDPVAEENQQRLAALDTMLNSLTAPDSNVQLLASKQNSVQAQQLRLASVQDFLASNNAAQDKVDHLVAFLADIPHAEPVEDHKKPERINKWDAGKVGGPKALLSKDAANYDPLDDEKIEHEAGLSDVIKKLAPHGRTKKPSETVFESEAVTPQYLAAEVKSASNLFSLASNQDQLPQMIFGGAFLLVAAVLLAVMTKRSAKKQQQQQRSKEDDAFAYALYH